MAGAAGGPSCADWNTEAFFENAAAADVARCLAAGADAGARDEGGGTPLHWAAAWNASPAVVAALLAAGADPAAKTEAGELPWQLVPEGSPLAGTDVYRRLEEARLE